MNFGVRIVVVSTLMHILLNSAKNNFNGDNYHLV